MIGCRCEVCRSADEKDKRLRSSILVQSANTNLVVDTGPDFRYQMLRKQISKLDAVVFTHPHRDHIAGLDDIRAYNYFQQRPIDVYADSLTEEALRRDFYYAFSDTRYPGLPELNMHTITGDPFHIADIPVQPVPVWHLKMPVMGFRFGAITYITDANRIDSPSKDLIRGSRVLILNALRQERHVSHFSLPEAIALVEELEIPVAYFTHISHQLGLHRAVSKTLPEGMYLSYDGLKITADNFD